jgi:hypothetical protein
MDFKADMKEIDGSQELPRKKVIFLIKSVSTFDYF